MNALVTQAIHAAYNKAIAKYPGEKKRIAKGLAIALSGKVQVNFGTLESVVPSGTVSDRKYKVTRQSCNCPDSKAPEKRCKHRYAVWLIRRAMVDLHSSYYVHTSPEQGNVLLGNVLLSELQKIADGNLAAKVCGYDRSYYENKRNSNY